MQLASYLERGPWMWMMPLHLNQNPDDDDDDDDDFVFLLLYVPVNSYGNGGWPVHLTTLFPGQA